MKRIPRIDSVIAKVSFPVTAVENFVNDHVIARKSLPADSGLRACDYELIRTCSTRVFVKGTVNIVFHAGVFKSQSLEIPVTAGFIATCIRAAEGAFRVGPCASLS
ncbi:MAG TPA: hypothetical protein VFZ78_10390 [Flavisolibacter sp.]